MVQRIGTLLKSICMLLAVNFHYIREQFDAPYPAIFGKTPKEFRMQLETLSKLGRFVSSKDIEDRVSNNESFSEKSIIITFDDGLKEQVDLAKPVLDEMGIPALFFINTRVLEVPKLLNVHKIHIVRSILSPELILEHFESIPSYKMLNEVQRKKIQSLGIKHYVYDETSNAYLKYLLNFVLTPDCVDKEFSYLLKEVCYVDEKAVHRDFYMSSETIVALATEGFIGSHAHDHLPLGVLPIEQARFQIEKSNEVLKKLGIETKAFSYPYGSREAVGDIPSYLGDYGFTFAFTMNRGVNVNMEKAFEFMRFDNNDVPGGKLYNSSYPIPHFEL